MKDCRVIFLSHYDFKDDKGNQIVGSKCKVAKENACIDVTIKGNSMHTKTLLKEYKCDLYINNDLKMAITNVL